MQKTKRLPRIFQKSALLLLQVKWPFRFPFLSSFNFFFASASLSLHLESVSLVSFVSLSSLGFWPRSCQVSCTHRDRHNFTKILLWGFAFRLGTSPLLEADGWWATGIGKAISSWTPRIGINLIWNILKYMKITFHIFHDPRPRCPCLQKPIVVQSFFCCEGCIPVCSYQHPHTTTLHRRWDPSDVETCNVCVAKICKVVQNLACKAI